MFECFLLSLAFHRPGARNQTFSGGCFRPLRQVPIVSIWGLIKFFLHLRLYTSLMLNGTKFGIPSSAPNFVANRERLFSNFHMVHSRNGFHCQETVFVNVFWSGKLVLSLEPNIASDVFKFPWKYFKFPIPEYNV